MNRPADSVRIEALTKESFDRFTSIEIVNDLTAPSECSVECGDDGTWRALRAYLDLGTQFKVIANGQLRMTGRLEAADEPIDAANGATARFVIRTKLSDAFYASAQPNIAIQGSTLKQLVLTAYAELGYRPHQFEFRTNVARDLMTGKPSGGKQTKETKLEPIKIEEARVNPPETIYEFVERHLLRFRLTHWDSPDGKIVVGAPNDAQSPLYRFICRLAPNGGANNVMSARRVRDASDSPSLVGVFSAYQATEFQKAKIGRRIDVPEVAQAKLYRPILLVDHSIQSREQAEARARREIVNRIRKLDSWEIHTDGWSFWNGQQAIPFGVDTVSDVEIEVASGTANGAYLVHRVRSVLNMTEGYASDLTCIRRGLWML
jgi:prophage tail gpP-like protein